MKKIKKILFPSQESKIFKGFGPAFLVIALGIGSGEFILWPYLSAHYGFGILWGALLGISIQLLIIVALERQTAFLGANAIMSFSRVFKLSFWWILISTLIGFGWPGFSAMASQLLVQGFGLNISETLLSAILLLLSASVLLLGKNAYKNILTLQKINMTLLLGLVSFLFIYYFDFAILGRMFAGFVGLGESYYFIPAGISLITFLGAVAYAGSGGNLLLLNSFYVEKEGKGLVPFSNKGVIEPDETPESIQNTRSFTRNSWKQNTLFFWLTGLFLIMLLMYISYAVLYGQEGIAENFTFLITEANIFRETIHPLVGDIFILSGALALFGVQLGILDFIGRVAGNKPGLSSNPKKQKVYYRNAIIAMTLFGLAVLGIGLSQPNTLILIGSTLNALSMGVIAFLLYRVETKLIPKKISSGSFKILLFLSALFYVGFFVFVVLNSFVF